MKNLIIIPTYNEAENVKKLYSSIYENYQGADLLFVDDNSPDGTGEILDKLSKEDSRVHVLHRAGKLGFATAYIDGFKWAFTNGYENIAEMDSDFSHSPTHLPAMFKGIENHDFVIGSRYIKNGGTKNWPFKRKLISSVGNMYARTVLWNPIHDLTGGFSIWKKEVLEKIDLSKIHCKGFVFQIELKHKAYKNGFKYLEVPIVFEDRKEGISKMHSGIVSEALLQVLKLKWNA